MSKNYYDILEVDKSATTEDIKKAYKKLAKKHHPDAGGDAEKFKELVEAYEILSDPDKKSNYDQYGSPKGSRGFNDHNWGGGFNAYTTYKNYNDFGGFQDFYQHQVKHGEDINLKIRLTLEEIYTGVTKKFKYKRKDKCGSCDGKGGHDSTNCPTCNGVGKVIREIRTNMGVFRHPITCPTCTGDGVTFNKPCTECNSSGVVEISDLVEIEIPAGIEEGITIFKEGKGHAVKGGECGDLVVNIEEIPHKTFFRYGPDLRVNLKLKYPQLVLGDKIEINTIDGGKIRVTIPEYSEINSILRVPNKGMKKYNKDERGDVVLMLDIEMPKHVDEETKELLKKLKN